jgi:hypothetical protein
MRLSLFDALRSGHSRCSVCLPPSATLTNEQRRRKAPTYSGYGTFLAVFGFVYLLIAASTFPVEPVPPMPEQKEK